MPSTNVALAFALMCSAGLLGVTAIQLVRITRSLVGLETTEHTLRARMAVVRLFPE